MASLSNFCSPKDTDAPGLNEAAKAGLLPTWGGLPRVHRLVGLAHGFASFRRLLSRIKVRTIAPGCWRSWRASARA